MVRFGLWFLCEKVSIECGLAEMMNRQGIPCPPQAADEKSLVPWTLDLAELYSMLPQEFHDTSFQPIRQTVYGYFSLKQLELVYILSHLLSNVLIEIVF